MPGPGTFWGLLSFDPLPVRANRLAALFGSPRTSPAPTPAPSLPWDLSLKGQDTGGPGPEAKQSCRKVRFPSVLPSHFQGWLLLGLGPTFLPAPKEQDAVPASILTRVLLLTEPTTLNLNFLPATRGWAMRVSRNSAQEMPAQAVAQTTCSVNVDPFPPCPPVLLHLMPQAPAPLRLRGRLDPSSVTSREKEGGGRRARCPLGALGPKSGG